MRNVFPLRLLRVFIHLCVFAFSASLEITAQTNDTSYSEPLAVIDYWIDSQKDFEEIPGISVAIVKDQQLVWSKGYGYADMQKKVPMDAGTLCSICSISKLFTSVAIMQLWEQGKLRLDDSVSMYLPAFKVQQDFESVPITIRALLTHSAGLPRESKQGYWTDPFIFPTEQQINDSMGKQHTVYPASTMFQYSNLGMSLLGEIVAKVSGMPYDKYVEQNILKPLGLTDTRPYMPKELWGRQLAVGYGGLQRDGVRRTMPFFQANGIAPAAGFSSSALDLAKFAQWQLRLLNTAKTELLNPSTLKEMQRVQWINPDGRTTWGLGFVVEDVSGSKYVGHGGACPGYMTYVTIEPKSKLGVVVMINAAGVSPSAYAKTIIGILNRYASDTKETTPSPRSLSDYAGIYNGMDWGSEQVFLPWKGRLLSMSFPSNEPLGTNPSFFKPSSTPDQFRFVRRDDLPGQLMNFERDASGKVKRVVVNSNSSEKVR
jgi:CubicO group peptidase (beta-lactamase class C family)